MSITVNGRLHHDAVHATSGPKRTAVIVLTIDAGSGQPFEVRHAVGDTPESHVNAARHAAHFVRGMSCCVVADRIDPRTDHGVATLVLRAPSAISVESWELL